MPHCWGCSGTNSSHPMPPRKTTPRNSANQRSVRVRVPEKNCAICVHTSLTARYLPVAVYHSKIPGGCRGGSSPRFGGHPFPERGAKFVLTPFWHLVYCTTEPSR